MSQPTSADRRADVDLATVHGHPPPPWPDADELRPARPEPDCYPEAEFTEVPRAAYPAYGLCGDPECFGREQR